MSHVLRADLRMNSILYLLVLVLMLRKLNEVMYGSFALTRAVCMLYVCGGEEIDSVCVVKQCPGKFDFLRETPTKSICPMFDSPRVAVKFLCNSLSTW